MPISLSGVSHSYQPGKGVLVDVNLDVAEGDDVALMGPSGSGKTTLLSIIGLLQIPSSGEIRLDGRSLPRSSQPRARLRAETFAWVFQTVNALGRRSAIDNVSLGLLARGMARYEAAQIAGDALDKLGIGSLADQPVYKLSGGELQRVCIARALANAPRFLCADEPTGQLDENTSRVVLDALWAARQPGTAIIVATHDFHIAARCGRVLRLVNGRLEEERG